MSQTCRLIQELHSRLSKRSGKKRRREGSEQNEREKPNENPNRSKLITSGASPLLNAGEKTRDPQCLFLETLLPPPTMNKKLQSGLSLKVSNVGSDQESMKGGARCDVLHWLCRIYAAKRTLYGDSLS